MGCGWTIAGRRAWNVVGSSDVVAFQRFHIALARCIVRVPCPEHSRRHVAVFLFDFDVQLYSCQLCIYSRKINNYYVVKSNLTAKLQLYHAVCKRISGIDSKGYRNAIRVNGAVNIQLSALAHWPHGS